MARYQRPEQTASFSQKTFFLRASNCAVRVLFRNFLAMKRGFVSSTLGLCRLPSKVLCQAIHQRPASGAAASRQASKQAIAS